MHEGPKDEVAARLLDPKTADLCRDYVERPTNFLLRLGSFDKFYLTHSRAHPDLVEHTLEEASQSLGLDRTETILKLAGDDGEDFAGVIIRHIFATPADLDKLLMDPYCSVGSDGAVASMEGTLSGLVMNRSSYGYAPRFIREYALDRGLMSVEEAVRKMTSLPAESVGIRGRGRIAPGMAADLVVMDLGEMQDNTTDAQPQAYPSGYRVGGRERRNRLRRRPHWADAWCTGPEGAGSAMNEDLAFAGALEILRSLVESKQVSPVEVAEMYLARIEQAGPAAQFLPHGDGGRGPAISSGSRGRRDAR